MGIPGIYPEIGPGRRVALSKLAVEKFEETGRPLRIAIDISIWLFQMQATKGGTNPAHRTFYYRLLRLIKLSIHPIFVFDGPNKPPIKRGRKTGDAGAAKMPEYLAKQVIKQFGFPIHRAPGEAEAECALLQKEGIVDAVLSDDVDTLMFGSGMTIRNWSPELKSGKTPTHVNVYDAIATKNGPSGLDREGLVLVALMSGADYDKDGVPGCGITKACEAARAGFGQDLCRLASGDKQGLQNWRERLLHEMKTNESKFFSRKAPSMVFPEDWPRADLLKYYAQPVTSKQPALEKLRNSLKWDQEIDFSGLRTFTYEAFDWAKLEGAKHFIRSLAPSLLVRHLRLRGEQIERFPTDNVQAIQEDEGLIVKGIHGKRQHAETDSTTELRVGYVPIDLVKIDLELEEPDDEESLLQCGEPDLDDENLAGMDEDEGPKKRGPTKFDPYKSYREWVLETYVKVGVPLQVQDWEAERQRPLKPKRTASANDASKTAPKPRANRRTKATDSAAQMSIQNFAKVTKAGVRSSRARSKTPAVEISQPASESKDTVVSLLSSSPMKAPQKAMDTDRSQTFQDGSLSPLPELPASITKRRRGPMQRARTLPSNVSDALDRPNSPLLDEVESLDLVTSLAIPSPSQARTKKVKMQTTKKSAPSRHTRAASVTVSPSKSRQTTLDAWRSPGTSPSKNRNATSALDNVPIPRVPRFKAVEADIDALDLTLSSPVALQPHPELSAVSKRSRQAAAPASSRPPLVTLSSSASNISNESSASTASKPSQSRLKLAPTSRRISPRLHRTISASPEMESLDLTQLSSPPHLTVRQAVSPAPRPKQKATSAEMDSLDLTGFSASPLPKESDPIPRRSPRTHKDLSHCPDADSTMHKHSPPAAWKTKERKKREIILRKSLAGAWTYIDAESPAKVGSGNAVVLKGKERRRWRESEIETLDLC